MSQPFVHQISSFSCRRHRYIESRRVRAGVRSAEGDVQAQLLVALSRRRQAGGCLAAAAGWDGEKEPHFLLSTDLAALNARAFVPFITALHGLASSPQALSFFGFITIVSVLALCVGLHMTTLTLVPMIQMKFFIIFGGVFPLSIYISIK